MFLVVLFLQFINLCVLCLQSVDMKSDVVFLVIKFVYLTVVAHWLANVFVELVMCCTQCE